jgi:hypothetical protein
MSRNYFDPVQVGQKPTLLEADQANKVYKALNQFANITVTNSDATSINYTSNGVEIKIKDLEQSNSDAAKNTVTTIQVEHPLKIEQTPNPNGDLDYRITLQGYTQFIKYCGGAGHVLFLEEAYNSRSEEVQQ